jgi:hypothetical protein
MHGVWLAVPEVSRSALSRHNLHRFNSCVRSAGHSMATVLKSFRLGSPIDTSARRSVLDSSKARLGKPWESSSDGSGNFKGRLCGFNLLRVVRCMSAATGTHPS